MVRVFGCLLLCAWLLAGCGEAVKDEIVETAPSPQAEPFDFQWEHAKGVTIYRGDSDEIKLNEPDALSKLADALQGSPSFSGDATADLNFTIAIAMDDGSKRKLEVSGGGSIFIDRTTKRTYSLNREKFDAHLANQRKADGQDGAKTMASKSWPFPFVVYNGGIYAEGDIEVVEAGKEIGEVTSYTDREGTYSGNFSNVYPVGTKYYEIPGTEPSEAIAVERGEGVYIRADYRGKYGG